MKSLLSCLFPQKSPSATVEPLEQRIAPAAIFWDGGGNGTSWTDEQNWSGDKVPTLLDSVTINPAGTQVITIDAGAQEALSLSVPGDDTLAINSGSLMLSASSTIGKLALSGGELRANGPLALTGTSTFSGQATLTGTGVVTVSGTLGIAGDPNLRTELRVTGTVNHGNAHLDFESAAARLRIANGGVYNTINTSDDWGFRDINNNALGVLVEAGGTFRHNSPNDARFVTNTFNDPSFNVTGGTIDVVKGTLGVNSTGSWTNATLTVAAGKALNFLNNSNVTINGTLGGSGAGAVNLTEGGVLTVPAAGATFNFPTGLFQWIGESNITGPGVLTNTGFIQISSGTPNLETELRNVGTIRQGNAHLDFEGTAGKLRILAGGLYETVNTTSDWGFRDIDSGALGVFVEAGGIFRHNSPNDARFVTNTFNDPGFNVTGGTLDVVKGTLGVNSTGSWTNATLTVAAGKALDFLNNSNVTINGTLGGSGGGAVNLTEGGVLTIPAAGSTFNFPTGLFQWIGESNIAGPGALTNTGFIQISSGTPNLETELRNVGTIRQGNAHLDFEGTAGKLRVLGGGLYETVNTTSDWGFRDIDSGALGVFVEAGGVFRHNSPNDARFLTNTFNNPGFHVIGGTLDVRNGTLGVNGSGDWTNATVTVAADAALNLLNGSTTTIHGTLGGSGAGIVNLTEEAVLRAPAEGATLNFPIGLFHWIGESNITGPGALTNTGFIQISSSAPNLETELRNVGTIRQGNAHLDFEGTAGKLRILAGGLYETVNTTSDWGFRDIDSGALGVFVEAGGVFRHNSPNDARFLTNTFNDPGFHVTGGTLDVRNGTLGVNGSGDWTNATVTVAADAALNLLNGSTTTIHGTLGGSGAGIVNLTEEAVLRAPAEGATLNLPIGLFHWIGESNITGPGVLTNTGFIQISSGAPNLETELRNVGTIRQGNAHLDFEGTAGKLRILAGGLYETVNTTSDWGFRDIDSGALGVFVEAGGVFRHNSPNDARFLTNTFNDPGFSNLGTLDVVKGTFLINGANAQVVGNMLTAGSWIVRSGATLNLDKNITGNAGSITIEGTGSFPGLGTLASNSGALQLLGGADLATSANFTNSGMVRLGEGAVFSTAGFTQTAAGTIEFAIGGTTPAEQGRLVASGAAALAGTARVLLASDLALGAGETITVASYASRTGDFARFEGLNLQRTTVLEKVVSDTGVALNSLVDAANLDVQTVTAPASGIAGQNVAFSYSVKNVSAFATLATSWTDTIYLSKDGTLSPDDVLFTRVTHSGAIAAGATYTENVNVPLIGAIPDDYQLLVLADSRGFVADPDRANNLGASTTTLALDVPTLAAGGSVNGTIKSGQDVYYRVALPQGVTPSFVLSGAVAGEAELYTSFGEVPTRGDFDESAFQLDRTVQRVVGDVSAPGTYYILVHGREAAGAGQNFTLSASGLGFDLLGAEAARGAALGEVTTTLSGAQFTPGTKFFLVTGGTERAAVEVAYQNANTAHATFDLTGLAPGNYTIRAQDGAKSDTLTGAFTVIAGGKTGTLDFELSTPRYIRPPFSGAAVTLTYQNTGDTDLPAPLFNLYGQNARVRLDESGPFLPSTYTTSNGQVVSIAESVAQRNGIGVIQASSTTTAVSVTELLGVSDGLAGVLSPGERGEITVFFEPIVSTAHAFSNFRAEVVTSFGTPLDFDVIKSELKPGDVSNDAWNAIFANFKASVGGTVGSYQSMLVENANYLGRFGPVSPDTLRLVEFELDQAGDFGSIADHFALGALGRGQAAPFSLRLTTEANGDVSIGNGLNSRSFEKLADGSYRPSGFDLGTLTQAANGVFTLDEGDGNKTVFRAGDGRVDFFTNANGRTLDIEWTATGQLLSATDVLTGTGTTFTSNAQGRIATATDDVGRVTTYGYDASGEHLTSVANAQGTTAFTYVNDPGTARNHAIESITASTGVTTIFTYDAQGRVTSQTIGSGANALTTTFSYDSAGGVTGTDGAAHSTQLFRTFGGGIARSVDPLGKVTSATYDTLGRVVSVTGPDGVSSQSSFDADGLLAGATGGDRTSTAFDFGGEIRRLQSVTDPGGDTTTFTYDSQGNLLATLLPDGFGQQFEYDTAGRVTAATDANGERATITYNNDGLITRRDLSDGTAVVFTYDAHRNLLTATDDGGTTSFTYDSADRPTSIAYPNGTSVTTTYDAAGRRATVADQTGYTVSYTYDSLGRLDTVRGPGNALISDYNYNALGQLSSETRGNGATTTYTYDAGGRTSVITHRDQAGNTTGFFNYTYDAQNRVATVASAAGTTTYGYDLGGQLTSAALPGGRTLTYTYDAEGNRTAVVDSAAGSESYTTNNGDQYTNAGGETLTYDRAGRILTRSEGGVTTSYNYDASGRLISTASGGKVTTYDYDALGNRIGIIENGVRTDYANDPAGLGTAFGEYKGGAATHYATGLGVAARADASGTSFYHFDALGNTALLSGNAGASIATYKYLPFGEVAAQTGASAQPFTFNGQLGVQDDAGDLFYMRARTYDAELGRFTTRDPIEFAGNDTNLYRYVGNDPVNVADPSGLNPLLGFLGGFSSSATTFGTLGTSGIGYALPGVAGSLLEGGAITGSLEISLGLGAFESATGVGTAIEALTLPALTTGAATTGEVVTVTLTGGTAAGLSSASVLGFAGIGAVAGVGSANYLVIPAFESIDNGFRENRDGFARGLGYPDPSEAALAPAFARNHGENILWSTYYKLAILDGKTPEDALLEATAKIKKLENDIIRQKYPKPTDDGDSEVIRPNDPNNIVGPAGPGADPLPELIGPGQTRFDGFVNGTEDFAYRIDFENQPSASAPAQIVTITQDLTPGADDFLDLATFQFRSFGFGDFKIDVPQDADGTSFHTIFEGARESLGVLVQVDAALDTITGQLQVTFTSLDPATNEVPADPFAGFLPPNLTGPEGDGYINYSVAPQDGLANGTRFTALASVVFDTEAAIATPTVTNTLDIVAPNSTINALPATSARTTFPVRYTAADDAAGSGVGAVSIFFTDTFNGIESARQSAAVSATAGGAAFTGEVGHTYRFFSQAFDAVGNAEALSDTPDATVTIVAPIFVNVGRSKTFTDADGDRYTIRTTGPGTTKVALLDPDGDGKGAIDFLQIDGSKAASTLSVTVQKKPGGDGRVEIGDTIINGSLGSFTAQKSDLVVNGVVATGGVGFIKVRDIGRDPLLGGTALVDLGGSSTLNFRAHDLADGFTLETAGAISSLQAASIGEGRITAASLGKLLTTAGAMNADLAIAGKVGPVSVASGVDAGQWSAQKFGAIKVSGGDLNADIDATKGIAKIIVKGGIGGDLSARTFGAISARGDVSGEITALAPSSGNPEVKSLTITGGDFTGDLRVLGKIGAITVQQTAGGVGGSITDATITARGIAALTVGKNVSDSVILAGADLGADHALGGVGLNADTFAAGAVGPVKIKGDFTASVLAAGLSTSDALFHNADDQIVGGNASRIAALVIRGIASEDSYFAGGRIPGTVQIAGEPIAPATDPRFLVG